MMRDVRFDCTSTPDVMHQSINQSMNIMSVVCLLLVVVTVFSGVVVADSTTTDSFKNAKDGVGSIMVPLTVIPMTECYPDLVTDDFPSPWYVVLLL